MSLKNPYAEIFTIRGEWHFVPAVEDHPAENMNNELPSMFEDLEAAKTAQKIDHATGLGLQAFALPPVAPVLAPKPAAPIAPSLPRKPTVGPTIAIVNMTGAKQGVPSLYDANGQAITAALQIQVDRDFGPAWNLGANLVYIPRGHTVPPNAWPIYLLDHSDQADALGYHDETAQNVPFSRVFVADDIADGLAPSVTISHELLEMLLDPWINDTVIVENNTSTGPSISVYAKEACDAVEDDQFAYDINGIMVSDFVLPPYFDPQSTADKKFSFRGNVRAPFTLADGGYISVLTAGPQGVSGWKQQMAQKAGRRQVKKGPSSRTLRRRQALSVV